MEITHLRPDIRYVGVNDRTKSLFEALWTLPHGVSYNSYLVIGERIALIDTVEEGFGSRLEANIRAQIGDRAVDYLVVNHMEPDHSSSIERLRLRYPAMRIVGNAKTIEMVRGYYGIEQQTLAVSDAERLDLGGKSLQFFPIPMVHWPETMVTYCPEERIAFTGDAFGTFGALDGGITDRQIDIGFYRDEMRRYYACIVGKYGVSVQKALQRLAGLPLTCICPTHGPVWEQHIPQVWELYDRMSRYRSEPGAVIAYGSMYGNTEQMAEQIASELATLGVRPIRLYNLSHADPSHVLSDIFRYDALIVGSPTYNGELFPPVAALLDKIANRGIPRRHFACFGSYTWACASARLLTEFARRMSWEPACGAVEMKQGFSRAGCQEHCRTIARSIARAIDSSPDPQPEP